MNMPALTLPIKLSIIGTAVAAGAAVYNGDWALAGMSAAALWFAVMTAKLSLAGARLIRSCENTKMFIDMQQQFIADQGALIKAQAAKYDELLVHNEQVKAYAEQRIKEANEAIGQCNMIRQGRG